jgi:sulfite reductase beta subunit-like hemoprotein
VHPEFSYLPRKFKIAVTGAARDRAAIQVHDIGLHLKKDADGRLGFAVYVGGGQGRTPMIAKKIRDFLPEEDLLSYTTAIVRVYNLHGRRDNKFKARIKILVHETGTEELTKQIEAEFAALRDGELKLPDKDIRAIETYFAPPPLTPDNVPPSAPSHRTPGLTESSALADTPARFLLTSDLILIHYADSITGRPGPACGEAMSSGSSLCFCIEVRYVTGYTRR